MTQERQPKQIPDRYKTFEGILSLAEIERLHKSKILVAGCGAGSTLAPHLARLGIGSSQGGLIILADPETVEYKNLGRQTYTNADIDRNKAAALANNMTSINPNLNIVVVQEGITRKNIKKLVESSELVVEMVDIARPDITFSLHEECLRQQKPLVTGLDLGDNTLSHVFDYSDPNAMSYREFLGLPDSIAVADFCGFNHLAVVAQQIIGLAQPLESSEEAKSYYNDSFFGNEQNMQNLTQALPKQMIPIVHQLLTGNSDHIPQTNVAGGLLGAVHSELVKRLILGQPVKKAPKPIRVYLSEIVNP